MMAVPTAKCPDCGMKRGTSADSGGVERFVVHRQTWAPYSECPGSGQPVERDEQALLFVAGVTGRVAAETVAPTKATTPPAKAVTAFLAGFAARTRYGEKPTAEQKRAADDLAGRFAAEIASLP